jgi:hypothetical protein
MTIDRHIQEARKHLAVGNLNHTKVTCAPCLIVHVEANNRQVACRIKQDEIEV